MERVSQTPFVILGILGILDDRPLSGYDIKSVIDQTISHFWSESFGQIYPVLKRLASQELISARAAKVGGRGKILYGITHRGRRRLRAWMEKTPEPGKPRDELILKLFFGSQTEIPVLIRHLQHHRGRAVAAGGQYRKWLKMLAGQHEKYTPFQIMTLRGGVLMSAAFLRWADESLATLNRMNRSKGQRHGH